MNHEGVVWTWSAGVGACEVLDEGLVSPCAFNLCGFLIFFLFLEPTQEADGACYKSGKAHA